MLPAPWCKSRTTTSPPFFPEFLLETECYPNPALVRSRTHSSMVPWKFWNVKESMKALLVVELCFGPF